MRKQKVTSLACRWMGGLALLGCSGLAWAQVSATELALSEKDFLADMPIVLSVSRLPQRLDETPGAVTIIDRDMIRRSGARDLVDLLRVVPGFQISNSFETGAPVASYHGAFDAYSFRMQVLIDGRSGYSPFLFGGTAPGMQAVALADVERIEVLRGSNSAAYGARAFLGVVNIVTRHPLDTLGLQAALTHGENGIRDARARLGWRTEAASFRLSLDRRADDGLSGSNGHNDIQRINFRADLSVSARDEIQLRAGGFTLDSGRGVDDDPGDAKHDRRHNSGYAQLDWRRNLGMDQDLALSLSHTEETYRDIFPYAPVPGVFIDFGGRASNDTVSLQHTMRHGANVRLVLGGEFSREQVKSKPIYNTDDPLVNDFTRFFGNLEWRPARDWIFNAGAMAEKSSVNGSSIAPRVMLNWHFTEGQTLRYGVSKAYRPPSAFEQFGDVFYSLKGVPLQVVTRSLGTIRPERVMAHEIGYLGEFPRIRVNLDVRAFHEKIGGFVERRKYRLPAGTTLFPSTPFDYFNAEDFAITGLEYEMKWRPWKGGQILFSQTFTDSKSINDDTASAAPKRASALTFFQKLPAGLDLSLMHVRNGTMTLRGSFAKTQTSRTDLRLGMPLRFGRNRGEVALVVQNLGSAYMDYTPEFRFERQAFVTLRMEN